MTTKPLVPVASSAIDPSLAALFSSSTGPVKPTNLRKQDAEPRPHAAPSQPKETADPDVDDDGAKTDAPANVTLDGLIEAKKNASSVVVVDKKRSKRKRKEAGNEDLEAKYLAILAGTIDSDDDGDDDDEKPAAKAKKRRTSDDMDMDAADEEVGGKDDHDSKDDIDNKDEKDEDEDDNDLPVHESLLHTTTDPAADDRLLPHESLSSSSTAAEMAKATRTVFVSNVAIAAVTDRAARRTLLAHLSSHLQSQTSTPADDNSKKPSDDSKKPSDSSSTPDRSTETIESIRFRSLAFSSMKLPKKAAFIKKEVQPATAKSAHAYVVYSTAAAAKRAVSQLNATVVLGRHIHVDSVAHPTPVDHRRCVFVGNLGFVDDQSAFAPVAADKELANGDDDDDDNADVEEDRDENTTAKSQAKSKHPLREPPKQAPRRSAHGKIKPASDIEEGLWRVFSKKAGRVESVRVIRDPVTRVGKGIAYVQFVSGVDVETALALDGKAFPPMLPRPLRVSRAKDPRKTNNAVRKRGEQMRKAAARTQADRMRGRQPANSSSAQQGGHQQTTTTTHFQPKITDEQKSLAGRAAKMLGRSAQRAVRDQFQPKTTTAKPSKSAAPSTTAADPSGPVIIEGHRATIHDKPKGQKPKGSGGGKKRKFDANKAKRAHHG